jgi:serine/threonine-protein kinase
MSSSLLQSGSLVNGRFCLIQMIGRGGMGSVWSATDQNLGTQCAVKFIEGQIAAAEEAQQRFAREAKAAAALRSQHVVTILDHGVWQGLPFIAMELLDGEDLGKRLEKFGGRLSPQAVVTVVHQVCRALTKAHAAGFVHRDLKPDNIFLVREGEDEIVKILDFGVAKQTGQAIEGTNTKTGAMLGTPYYMSPEQAQGIKSVDFRSDLWSLAVIVFQCITGRLPFESEALGDLLVKIIMNKPPLPSSFDPSLPPTFDEWWVKAAQNQPENRFQSAKELSQTLQQALNVWVEGADRSHMARNAGGTAAMADAGQAVAAMRQQLMSTPFPPPQNQQQAMGPMATPQGLNYPPQGKPPQQQLMMTPQNAPMSPVASGATFSGMDSPAGVPTKKGPPIGLLVGLLALGIIGIAAGGYAVVASRAGKRAAAAAASASATTEPTSTVTATTSVATNTAPTDTATATTTPTSTVASAEPTSTAAVATNEPTSHHRVVPVPSGKATATTTTTASAKPTATTAATTTAAPKPSGTNLGF